MGKELFSGEHSGNLARNILKVKSGGKQIFLAAHRATSAGKRFSGFVIGECDIKRLKVPSLAAGCGMAGGGQM